MRSRGLVSYSRSRRFWLHTRLLRSTTSARRSPSKVPSSGSNGYPPRPSRAGGRESRAPGIGIVICQRRYERRHTEGFVKQGEQVGGALWRAKDVSFHLRGWVAKPRGQSPPPKRPAQSPPRRSTSS